MLVGVTEGLLMEQTYVIISRLHKRSPVWTCPFRDYADNNKSSVMLVMGITVLISTSIWVVEQMIM